MKTALQTTPLPLECLYWMFCCQPLRYHTRWRCVKKINQNQLRGKHCLTPIKMRGFFQKGVPPLHRNHWPLQFRVRATCTQHVSPVQFCLILQLFQPNAEPDYCIEFAQGGETEVYMTYWYMWANAEVRLTCRWHWTGAWAAGAFMVLIYFGHTSYSKGGTIQFQSHVREAYHIAYFIDYSAYAFSDIFPLRNPPTQALSVMVA